MALKRVLAQRPSKPVPFVVIGAERTGSNYLLEVMGLEPGREWFNPRLIDDDHLPLANRQLRDDPALLRLRLDDPEEFLRQIEAIDSRLDRSISGFKFLYSHGEAYPEVIEALQKRANLKVIHLLRHQRIERFLSLVTASTTGVWYQKRTLLRSVARKPDPIRVDPAELLEDLVNIEQLERRYNALFDRQQTMTLSYEDLVGSSRRTRRRISDFLGTSLPRPAVQSAEPHVLPLADRILNFEEVEEALHGTLWAGLIKGPESDSR